MLLVNVYKTINSLLNLVSSVLFYHHLLFCKCMLFKEQLKSAKMVHSNNIYRLDRIFLPFSAILTPFQDWVMYLQDSYTWRNCRSLSMHSHFQIQNGIYVMKQGKAMRKWKTSKERGIISLAIDQSTGLFIYMCPSVFLPVIVSISQSINLYLYVYVHVILMRVWCSCIGNEAYCTQIINSKISIMHSSFQTINQRMPLRMHE